jgi:hypothetical protein
LGAKIVDLDVHSREKEFSRRGGNPGALKLQNLFALTARSRAWWAAGAGDGVALVRRKR